MKKVFFFSLFIIGIVSSQAQTLRLLKDINHGTGSSTPSLQLILNDTLYFVASDTTFGTELWKSDGTKTGTVMVKDMNPGKDSSLIPEMVPLNNDTLIFINTDSANGKELWMTNGSDTATKLVKNIYPGKTGSSLFNLVKMKNHVFFFANDSTNGMELWRTDGTDTGTVLIKNVNTLTVTGCSPGLLTNFKDSLLLFHANDGVNGVELWKSDGTAGGSSLIKNIMPGVSNSSFTSITPMGNYAIVIADSTNSGLEPWRTDGSASGTYKVKEIFPGLGTSAFTPFAIYNGSLYGRANNGSVGLELWKCDGTAAGTVLVKDFMPGPPAGNPAGAAAHSTGLFLNATSTTATGYELWKSDGTSAGTVLIKDINTGSGSSAPAGFTALDSIYIFSANEATNGRELWRTNKTTAGTFLLANINPGSASSNPYGFNVLKGDLIFAATDSNGVELWKLPSCHGLSVTVTGIDASTGNNTGSASAVVSGGVPGFSYTWSNGDSLPAVDSLSAGTYTVVVTDTNGCTVKGTVTISNVTGISQHANAPLAVVTKDNTGNSLMVSVRTEEALSLELFNQLGQAVYSGRTSSHEKEIRIPLCSFPGGIYFIKLQSRTAQFVQRFIVD